MSPVLEAALLITAVTGLFAVLGFVLYQAYSLGWSARDGKAIGEVMVLERECAELKARNKVLEREADGVASAGQSVVDRAAVGRTPDGPDGDGMLLGRPGDVTAATGGGAAAAPGAPA